MILSRLQYETSMSRFWTHYLQRSQVEHRVKHKKYANTQSYLAWISMRHYLLNLISHRLILHLRHAKKLSIGFILNNTSHELPWYTIFVELISWKINITTVTWHCVSGVNMNLIIIYLFLHRGKAYSIFAVEHKMKQRRFSALRLWQLTKWFHNLKAVPLKRILSCSELKSWRLLPLKAELCLTPIVKTLFNIVEAPWKSWTLMSVLYDDVHADGPINGQEYNIFDIYAVTIKISMTEYHHWINGQAYHLLYSSAAVHVEKLVR